MNVEMSPEVYLCPDGRVAVKVNIHPGWLMVDYGGEIHFGLGEISSAAVPLVPARGAAFRLVPIPSVDKEPSS